MAEEVREQVLQLPQFLTDLANTIRNKKGYSPDVKINAQDFNSEIESISTAKEEEEKSVDVDFSLGNQVVVPTGDKVLSKVTINKPVNLTPANIRENVVIGGVVGALSTNDMLQAKVDAANSCKYLFYNYQGKNVDFIAGLDTSKVTDMSYMFSNCPELTSVPQLDTSKVTDMSYMFNDCHVLTTIPQLNTSSCTNMKCLFNGCNRLTSVPQLDTSNVTNINSIFQNCYKLTSIPQLDTSKVTDMGGMFEFCEILTTIPQINTISCTNMRYMFANIPKLTIIDITHMNITSSFNTGSFAKDCYSLKKLIIRNMDTAPTLYSDSFSGCYHFTGKKNSTYNPEGLKDGRIYVPDAMVDTLKQATNWSTYADIIVPLSTLEE